MSPDPISPQQKADAIAWVRQVIVKPWAPGAQGPDAYDCGGLTRATQKLLANRDVPLVNADPRDLRGVINLLRDQVAQDVWAEVPTPRHLDIVLLAHHRHANHVGTFLQLDDGGVLHACEQFNADGSTSLVKPGVTFDPLMVLKLQGWSRFRFFRPRGEL